MTFLSIPFHVPPALILAASSAAGTASAARRGPVFDPATTLAWSVPLLMLAPLLGLVLVLSGIRTRRAAADLTLAALAVSAADAVLVGWATWRSDLPLKVGYPWLNLPESFAGAPQFQTFQVDINLRVDHLAVAAVLAVTLALAGAVAWHRSGGRGEQGPVRFQVAVLLVATGAAGVGVSGDYLGLLAFWCVAGIGSYLLLSHRWGTIGGGRAAQLALGLPWLADLCLVAAVALLYSRYGQVDLDKLFPVLGLTLGVGAKTRTLAALLVGAAVMGRAALWPAHSWQAAAGGAPPAAQAAVQATWTVLPAVLLFRSLPLFPPAGPQASAGLSWALAVATVLVALLALAGNDIRRGLTLAGIAASGLGLLTLLAAPDRNAAGVALAAALALALARGAALVGAGSITAAMRSHDLGLLAQGLARMRLATLGLGLAALAMTGFALAPAIAARPARLSLLAYGVGGALVAMAALRPVGLVAFGTLRRRRTFEPDRVRDAPAAQAAPPLALGLAALGVGGLAFWAAFAVFLAGRGLGSPEPARVVLWLLPAAAGAVVMVGAAGWRRDLVLALGARLGAADRRTSGLVEALFDRFLRRPAAGMVDAVEGRALPAAEGAAARALETIGILAGRPLPALALLLVGAAVLVVGAALVGPALAR